MAITHFKFHVLPRKSLESVHDGLPEKLPEYQENVGIEPSDDEVANYWENNPLEEIKKSISLLLPLLESWDSTNIYGYKDGTKVEICDDDFLIKFDAVRPNFGLLKDLFELSKMFCCVVVPTESGKVLNVGFDDFMNEFYASRAFRYTRHPEDVLNEIRAEKLKH